MPCFQAKTARLRRFQGELCGWRVSKLARLRISFLCGVASLLFASCSKSSLDFRKLSSWKFQADIFSRVADGIFRDSFAAKCVAIGEADALLAKFRFRDLTLACLGQEALKFGCYGE